MGCAISCDKCPSAVRNSVITFSEDLVYKIADGVEPEPLTEKELHDIVLPDFEWFERLRCIDDSHSNAYGITKAGVYSLLERLEKRSRDMKTPPCAHDDLSKCLSASECPLECAPHIKKYIDCTDETRVKIMIRKLEEWAEEDARLAKEQANKKLKNKC